MADYWKSLPKKYCDFCKCWFADNKASVEFHERGFRHQLNVKRKLQDLQRKGSKQVIEENKYNLEMMKIESQALKAFQSDVTQNPDLGKELATNVSLFKKSNRTESTAKPMSSRYGDDDSTTGEESTTLVVGRQRALETIAKKMEKKSKWLERKTTEGKTYYVNKETFETKWTEPKSGFLSVEEQKYSSDVTPDCDPLPAGPYNPYGRWKTVANREFDDKMIDLQLPDQQLPQIVAPIVADSDREVKIEFSEKTVDSLKNKFNSSVKKEEKISFKKRKTDSNRSVRQRTDD